MSDNVSVLLVGAGYMGMEYSKVLSAQGIPYIITCRSKESADRFEKEGGGRPISGGVKKVVMELDELPTHAIVATNVNMLMEATMVLISAGIKKILVEKPGGLNTEQIRKIAVAAKNANVAVYIAYNRRFYASTDKALEIIATDGGVLSFNFEFTEWGNIIETLEHAQEIKDAWLFANSSHVIDLAFFLGGFPYEMNAYKAGSLTWHKNAGMYSGAGRTGEGALFSYQANWNAPGRWAVEILTREHRLFLRPMEQLFVQKKGSLDIDGVEIADDLDKEFKPGLYQQTKAFLMGEHKERLLTIEEQLSHMSLYELIENGGSLTN